jgi:hypothetical protein
VQRPTAAGAIQDKAFRNRTYSETFKLSANYAVSQAVKTVSGISVYLPISRHLRKLMQFMMPIPTDV